MCHPHILPPERLSSINVIAQPWIAQQWRHAVGVQRGSTRLETPDDTSRRARRGKMLSDRADAPEPAIIVHVRRSGRCAGERAVIGARSEMSSDNDGLREGGLVREGTRHGEVCYRVCRFSTKFHRTFLWVRAPRCLLRALADLREKGRQTDGRCLVVLKGNGTWGKGISGRSPAYRAEHAVVRRVCADGVCLGHTTF